MNRKNLTDFVSEGMSITKTDAKAAVDEVINGIINGIGNDEKVSIMGFGTFYIIRRTERQIKNPKTGEMITVPAKKVVKFKPTKILKDRINDWSK